MFTYTAIPTLIILSMLISKPIEKYTKEEQKEISYSNTIAQECITGISIVKSFTLEEKMNKKYSNIKIGLRMKKKG